MNSIYNTVKRFASLFTLLAAITLTTSCSDDEWGNDNAEMENIYYIGFQDWGQFKNDVKFTVNQGSTVAVPMQFWCEFNRSYDVTTYYYIVSDLKKGVDYEVVDESGSPIALGANGGYSMVWKNALKGIQNVNIKALNGAKGSLTIQTLDPASGVTPKNSEIETTFHAKTDQYEVRLFTQNYKVAVTIK